jgi:hypothetical protein
MKQTVGLELNLESALWIQQLEPFSSDSFMMIAITPDFALSSHIMLQSKYLLSQNSFYFILFNFLILSLLFSRFWRRRER